MKIAEKQKVKLLSVLLPTILMASEAFSMAVLESEFEMLIPRQFQQSLIEQKWKTLQSEQFKTNWQLPEQVVYADDVPVHINGMELSIATYLAKPELSQDTKAELNLESKSLEGVLKIASVSVDHIVEREVGGIIGRFRIQAQCKNVILNLKKSEGHFSLRLSSQLQANSMSAVVRDFDLGWTSSGWTPESLDCEGAGGFDQVLNAKIQELASDSKAFVAPHRAQIQELLEKNLGQYTVDFSGVKKMVTSRPDVEATFQILEYRDELDSGAWGKGILRLEFTKVQEDSVKSLKIGSSLLSENINTDQVVLRLPKDFAKEAIKRFYAPSTWMERVSSSKVPGFSSVMNSRLTQFFIWPELRKYSKSSKFLFDLSSNKNLEVTGEGLSYRIRGALYAKMWAPRSQYVPFMHFNLPLSSQVKLSVDKGVLSGKLQNSSVSLGYSWDKDYVKKYRSSSRFAASAIRSKIASGLINKVVRYKLPLVPLFEEVQLSVDNAKVSEQSELNLYLSPKNP